MRIVRTLLLQASFAGQLFRFGKLQILTILDPCLVFIIPQTMGVELKCQKMRSENVGRCKMSESTPPVRYGGEGFMQVQWDWIIPKGIFFSKQSYSQLQGYGRRNTASGTPFHAYTQTRIRTQYTDRSKKAVFCNYLSKWNGYSFSYVYYHFTSQYPPPFFLFQLAKAARSIPTSRCPKPSITPRQHVAWRFVSRREFSRT